MKPVFLLSLPRSGSTVVQRILASHPEIRTASEPWLLLPHTYAHRSQGIRAEYWQEAAAIALRDFCRELPGGAEHYRRALGDFVMGLYEAAAGAGAKYFVDKTPHYHAIAEDLQQIFGDARFVILWRNPLAVLSSMLATFRSYRFEPHLFEFDLYDGIANLSRFAASRPDGLHTVRFEDLAAGSVDHWAALFGHLDLDFEPAWLDEFGHVSLRGRVGDPRAARSSALVPSPADAWKACLSGWVRKSWCARWLNWIGQERMSLMGYDLNAQMAELESLPSQGTGAIDLLQLCSSWATARLRSSALAVPDSTQAKWSQLRGFSPPRGEPRT